MSMYLQSFCLKFCTPYFFFILFSLSYINLNIILQIYKLEDRLTTQLIIARISSLILQFLLLLVCLALAPLSIFADESSPEPAEIQPPPGFDSGFNGPSRDPNNFGVHVPVNQPFQPPN